MKPNSPDTYSPTERAQLAALLDHGDSWIRPYTGPWTASWLLSEVTDCTWNIRKPSTRYFNDAWVSTRRIRWDIPLSDGSTLGDPQNFHLLKAAQQGAFLVRTVPSFGVSSQFTFVSWLSHFQTIIQWLMLYSDIYQPRQNLFKAVTDECIADCIRASAGGGKAWALKYPQACLRLFYERALFRSPERYVLSNPFGVPEADRKSISAWLHSSEFNATHGRWGLRYINRGALAKALGSDVSALGTDKFSAFLRQFEPDFLAAWPDLLVPVTPEKTEYPAHSTLTLQHAIEAPLARTQLRGLSFAWQSLFRLARHLPDSYPALRNEPLRKSRAAIRRYGMEPQHTPLVPLAIALSYTNEALRWILIYGEDLTDFYIRAVKHFHKFGPFDSDCDKDGSSRTAMRNARDSWVAANLPQSLRPLGISQWGSQLQSRKHEEKYVQYRAEPALTDAVQILLGAMIVLLCITKPMRISELARLKRRCVSYKERDGYWLRKHRAKGGTDGPRESDRPIPAVTARAIALVERLSNAASDVVCERDPFCMEAIFYLPTFSQSGTFRTRLLEKAGLQFAIDRFCDFVALPVDDQGRRWYLRVHEMRKSFLIVFFWLYKFASLDAARWIAEHDDPKHLYAYIQANMPGEELSEIEAQYAQSQLWDFAHSKHADAQNVKQLHDDICKHFGVREIGLVETQVLKGWLSSAFAKGIYEIEVFAVGNSSSHQQFEIAFRLTSEDRHA